MVLWPWFGLVTLVAAGAWSVQRRLQDAWGGVAARLPARRAAGRRPASAALGYRWSTRTARDTLHVTFAVDTASRLDFECRREGRWHRVMKKTGLLVEQQVGHDAFDAAVYLVSDDPRVLDALRASPAAVEDLSALFRAPLHRDFRARRLVCRRGELRVEFDSEMTLTDVFGDLAAAVVPLLRRLADGLPAERADGRRDPGLWRSLLVLGLSSGLAISGSFQLFRVLRIGVASTVDLHALAVTSAIAGAGLLAALVFVALVLLARTSRLPILLAEVLLVGGFGAFATATTVVRDLNMALDRSGSSPVVAEIAGKDVRRTRRSGRRYYLEFAAVPPGLRSREVRVGSDVHALADVGDCAEIHRRDGRFGIAWFEKVAIVACPGAAPE